MLHIYEIAFNVHFLSLYGMAKKAKQVKTVKKELTPAMLKLGKRIRQLRKDAGYTNFMTFAYDHGFNPTQIARWEQGANIRFDSLCRLAKAFDMTVSELLEGF